jgi:hypothetical protein
VLWLENCVGDVDYKDKIVSFHFINGQKNIPAPSLHEHNATKGKQPGTPYGAAKEAKYRSLVFVINVLRVGRF